MSVQHFRVKVFASEGAAPDLGKAIPVFHRWIQQNTVPGHLLIDVADYQQVPQGPGIMLIANEAFFGLDQSRGRLGLLYNRRTVLDGTVEERLRQAVEAALSACSLLEQAPEFEGRLRFDAGDLEVSVNDRLLAPNTSETFQKLEPSLRQVFDQLWGQGTYQLVHEGEARELFRVRARRNGR